MGLGSCSETMYTSMQSVVIAEGVGVEVGDGSDRSGGGTNQDGGRL